MIKEYQAFKDAFYAGKSIKDSAKAKNYAVFGNSIGILLISLFTISQGLGYHIPVSNEDLMILGKGAGTLYLTVNAIIHVITSEKVGIKK